MRKDLNIFTNYIKDKKKLKLKMQKNKLIAITMVVVLLVIPFINYNITHYLDFRLNKFEANFSESKYETLVLLKNEQEETAKIKDYINNIEDYVASKKSKYYSQNNQIKGIYESVDENMIIKKINYDMNSYEVEGDVAGRAGILNFETKLKNNGFGQMHLEWLKKIKTDEEGRFFYCINLHQ